MQKGLLGLGAVFSSSMTYQSNTKMKAQLLAGRSTLFIHQRPDFCNSKASQSVQQTEARWKACSELLGKLSPFMIQIVCLQFWPLGSIDKSCHEPSRVLSTPPNPACCLSVEVQLIKFLRAFTSNSRLTSLMGNHSQQLAKNPRKQQSHHQQKFQPNIFMGILTDRKQIACHISFSKLFQNSTPCNTKMTQNHPKPISEATFNMVQHVSTVQPPSPSFAEESHEDPVGGAALECPHCRSSAYDPGIISYLWLESHLQLPQWHPVWENPMEI